MKQSPADGDEKPISERMRQKKAAKRSSILLAAQTEFATNGFANARLSNVARAAGVAKGTLYLYFESKEALFEGVVRETLLMKPPVLDAEDSANWDIETFRQAYLDSIRDLEQSGRSGIALVALTEGHLFPQLIEIYINAVLDPVLSNIATWTQQEADPRLETIRRFPQLLIAPVLTSLLWNRFMTNREPVDLVAIAAEQLSLMLDR